MKTASEILLTKAEGQDFDRKAAGINLRDLANILVAFANADGGTVAIGIKNKQFEGINHLDAHRIKDICQLVWLTKNTSYENVGGIFLRKNTIDS